MKLASTITALLLVAALAAPASAEEAKEKPKKPKLICRTETATGSRTRVNRICATQSEWDRMALETNKSINDLGVKQGQGTTSNQPPTPF
jgi:hypothetical protein